MNVRKVEGMRKLAEAYRKAQREGTLRIVTPTTRNPK